MSEHDVAAKCARQVSDLQAENARLRDGLRAVGVIVAGLSMTDVNFGRAELARLEHYISGVLGGATEYVTTQSFVVLRETCPRHDADDGPDALEDA